MMREYIATSERRHSDEIECLCILYNTELKVGDVFTFDGIPWVINEVCELRADAE